MGHRALWIVCAFLCMYIHIFMRCLCCFMGDRSRLRFTCYSKHEVSLFGTTEWHHAVRLPSFRSVIYALQVPSYTSIQSPPNFYWVWAPYPLKPSANFHSVAADLESLILTPSSVIVATWYCFPLSDECFQP